MSATDWLVVMAGGAGILWVNWYFFLAEGRGEAPPRHEGRGAEVPGRNP